MGKKTISDEKKVVIKSLADMGLSYRKIQGIIPISLGYIGKVIKEFDENRELIDFYRKNRADILLKAQLDDMALQEVLRDSVAKADLEKWTPDQRARWFQALTIDGAVKLDKERLIRGESTENISFHADIAILKGHIPAKAAKITENKG